MFLRTPVRTRATRASPAATANQSSVTNRARRFDSAPSAVMGVTLLSSARSVRSRCAFARTGLDVEASGSTPIQVGIGRLGARRQLRQVLHGLANLGQSPARDEGLEGFRL